MTKVKIRIKMEVTATVELAEGETVEQLKERYADIYLHGAGENGHINKVDLGGSAEIQVIEVLK